ncbi:MAG: electron transfer flavoprotein subunit alpha/FixB family protein [Desulfobacula sp.]|nr:electron transfer flavoprotein subunit alpha/FixB family protein [Desulfobacula sp.]
MKNIGIIIETDTRESDAGKSNNSEVKDICFGMITLARQKNCELFAFVFNSEIKALKPDLESFGITNIVDVALAAKHQNNPAIRAKAMVNAVKKFNIHAVLGLCTPMGKDLLPRMAAHLDAPLVMDCIHVDFENFFAKTSQYSGKAIATIKITGDIPVFGVRPNSIEQIKAQASARILKFDGENLVSKKFIVIKTGEYDKSADINLAEADIIIAGGRGMQNSENFNLLSKCAKRLHAAVGASRVAVDEGWVPYSMQVGQTGEKVNPKVYIACGISGSIQHFAGMKTSGMVIAINTDGNAAIMSNCDYYVKADVLKIIPKLTKLLKNE